MNPEVKLPPKIVKVPLHLKVDPKLKEALKEEARKQGRTETEILETVLEWGLLGKGKK